MELFTMCAVVLSCIKWVYSFFSFIAERRLNHSGLMFGIYCSIKNMGPIILHTLVAYQT
jgi:uncharacterized membrane protein